MAKKKTGENTEKVVKKTTTEKKIEPIVDADKIKEEIVDYINNDVKDELNTHINQQIKKEIIEILEKQHKKEIKEKNKKILRKNILIFLLLVSIGLLLFLLYDNGYFNRYLKNINKEPETIKKEEKQETPTVKEPTLEELKTKYTPLLNKYILFDTSNYYEDFYNKNMTDQLKLYFVFSNLDFKDLETEDDYYLIDENVIKDKYNDYFDGDYKSTNFEYNTHRVRFFTRLNSYITDNIFEKDTSNKIVRVITDIKEDNDLVTITTIEGIVEENTLINPRTRELIDEEYNDNLQEYSDALEKVTYVFEHEKLKEIR